MTFHLIWILSLWAGIFNIGSIEFSHQIEQVWEILSAISFSISQKCELHVATYSWDEIENLIFMPPAWKVRRGI